MIRRIAHIGLALAACCFGSSAISAAPSSQDAQEVLTRVGQVMRGARSLHTVMRVPSIAPQTPSGFKMMPGRMETWQSRRAFAVRIVLQGKGPVGWEVINADTGEWQYCDPDTRTVYAGNFKPLGAKADAIISQAYERDVMTVVGLAIGLEIPEPRMRAAVETRAGRKVHIITASGRIERCGLQPPSRPTTGRNVIEVDAKTYRLLRVRQYAQPEGGAEELVGSIEKVEYDTPLPPDLARPKLPRGVKALQAAVWIEQVGERPVLVMTANGVEVNRFGGPLQFGD